MRHHRLASTGSCDPAHGPSRRFRGSPRARELVRACSFFALFTVVIGACSTDTSVTRHEDPIIEVRARGDGDDGTAMNRGLALDGATVDGFVTAFVRERADLLSVAFHLDDEPTAEAPIHTAENAPFEATFDASALVDGEHVMTVAATYGEGRTSIVSARFFVDNDGMPTDTTVAVEATLYVAASGSDSNDGLSIDRPLRTVQKAADVAQPGDVVALRGGVYPIHVRFHRDGTQSDPIVWTSYPGEIAIFDGSDQTPVESSHRVTVTADWNVFENLEIRDGPQEGVFVHGGHDNVFRHLDVHGHHYSGILNDQSDRNLYQDLLVHDNYDRFNPSGRIGDDADGIGMSSGTGNVVRRVVAYRNSDDGIDTWRATHTLIEDSVAWGNGLGSHGNGNGVKAGGASEVVNTVVRRSIAFDNRAHGFDDNSGKKVTFLNTTAFGNGGYAYVAGADTVLRNNLAVTGAAGLWGADSAYNNWDLGISEPRLESVDPVDPAFLRLRADSSAIDAGIEIGLAYTGAAPDLGALGDGRTFASLVNRAGVLTIETVFAAAD